MSGKPVATRLNPGDERQILCASCRKPLPANRANISPDGLVCEPCWRAQEAILLAKSDQANREKGAVAVGGALLGIAAVMLGAAVAGSRES